PVLFDRETYASSDRSPMEARILIDESNQRANMLTFTSNIDCPAILHEFLHHLGLPDEYYEPELGHWVDPLTGRHVTPETPNAMQITKYSCRTVGPPDSVMSNHLIGEKRMQPHRAVTHRLWACFCPAGKENCLTEIDSINRAILAAEERCPDAAVSQSRTSTSKYWSQDPTMNPGTTHFSDTPSGFSMMRVVRNRNERGARSLLYPAQFRAIIYPNCEQKNALYLECGRKAYDSQCTVNRNPGCEFGSESWLQ
ncbi:MAG: hypothetical protein V4760_10645, partial [Bdellovibrionota bacterium]